MKGEHFTGVVWPREPINGTHRYVVLGMIITTEPIAELEAKNQLLFDGLSALEDGLLIALRSENNTPLGTADMVLTRLNYVRELCEQEAEEKL